MTENEKETKTPLTQAANGAMMRAESMQSGNSAENKRNSGGKTDELFRCFGQCPPVHRQILQGLPVCNGVACKNQIPGPGAKGVGDTAIRNYNKWADIRVNMDTLCENGTPTPTWSCSAAASSTPSSPALWAR